MRLCWAAVGAYARAALAMPDEWLYHFYHGKMAAKAGQGSPTLLSRLPCPLFLQAGTLRALVVAHC